MDWVSSSFDILPSANERKNKFQSGSTAKPSKRSCTNLWVDEYPPLCIKDLSVHKKKIEEVRTWLIDSGHGLKEKKILLLSGPPGSGKSTTMSILARDLTLALREWRNSDSLMHDGYKDRSSHFASAQERVYVPGIARDFASTQADRFADFIYRSSKYRNICASSPATSSVILIEEIPNAFILNPLEFHQIMRRYSASCYTPIVFILSEANNSTFAKTLFPNEFQEEIFITNIIFNPVSTTLLTSALVRVLDLTGNTRSSLFDSPSSKKQFLQNLAVRSDGDARSAINALQFALMKDDVDVVSGANGEKKSSEEKALVHNLIGCKDSSLFLFRALGKILYCKRENAHAKDHTPLPPHLREHERTPTLESPEEVFERSSTEASTFCLFLHHNCPHFFTRIEDLSAAAEYLSDADVLDAFWDPSEQLKTYTSSVALRGMMHSVGRAPKAAPNTFRALTRPQWFAIRQTSTERLCRIRRLDKHSNMTNEEICCNYVPFLPKIYPSSATEIDRFVEEVGLLYPSSAESIPRLASDSKRRRANVDAATLEASHPEEEEDYFIEEFDD